MTQRGTGKRSYDLFLDALDRLQTTGIKTTIVSADQRERRTFTWIASSRVLEDVKPDGARRMKAVEIELCDWMFRASAQDRRVLAISPSHFKLTGGIARRLYELARKHCGRQPEWRISLPRLAEKVGTTRTLRALKHELKAIIERDALPEYVLGLAMEPGDRVIWRLDAAAHAPTWDNGEGAYLAGGRWNSRGRRAVYASLDPVTAILEVAMHKGFRALDRTPHVLTSAQLLDPASVHIIDATAISNAHWLRPGLPRAGQQQFGDALLAAHPVVLLPSVVSPHSWNVVLDPAAAARLYAVLGQEPFTLDPRLHPPA